MLIESGQVTSRGHAAAHLALHRNTVATWCRRYCDGGLEAVLTYKKAGAPAGQKTLPPPVCAQLKTRLATPPGFASYLDIQRWLRDEFALEVPYKILHGMAHDQLKATLQRPWRSQAKNVAAAAGFVKQCPRCPDAIATLGRQVPDQPVRVFCQDASRRGLYWPIRRRRTG